MISLSHFNSLPQIFRYFKSRTTCLKFIEEQVYPDGTVACPYCGSLHPYRRSDGRFKCRECGSSFSILQGTIFQDTKLPLYKWFGAIYLMSVHSKGISSVQAAIDLGLKNLCNGVDNLGSVVVLPNKARRINRYFRKQISAVQSKMDKCIKGSSRHCKLKKNEKETVQQKERTDKTDSTYPEQKTGGYELQDDCSW